MKKTLILAVDRDDDFGAKAGVESPVIGVDNCIAAATALGIADPEDSDTNGLYAAINLYRQMTQDPDVKYEVEVALLCGSSKVGYKSDEEIVRQLGIVMDETKPTNAILIGDGAEDEYIYPIISSRLPIDSVKKVYVKQAATVESAFYIFKRMFDEPQKRKRFIAPISWILMFLSIVYIFTSLFTAGSLSNFVKDSTTFFILFLAGLLLAFYAYNLEERVTALLERWDNRAKRGSIMTVFLGAAMVLVILGIVIGVFSLNDVYTERDLHRIIVFFVYSQWFYIIAIILYLFGVLLDSYIYTHKVRYNCVSLILNTVSLGLITSGALDYAMDYAGLYSTYQFGYIIEIVGGFMLAIVATVAQLKIRSNARAAAVSKEKEEDEI